MDVEDELQEAFGRALAALRKERGLSQRELGEAADLARTYVSELELGLKSPSLRSMARLAAALGVSVSLLVTRAEGG